MGRNVRLGLLACAGLSTLAFAAVGSAERLGVSSTPSSGVVIHYSQPTGAPAPAMVTIFPNPSYLAGTQVQNFSQAPGTTIGTDFVIRICVVSHRTHMDRMQMCLEDIRASVAELS